MNAAQGVNKTAEESLRSKLERTVARNAELEKSLNSLSGELDSLKTEANKSDGRLSALNEELARLQSRERVLNEENRGLGESVPSSALSWIQLLLVPAQDFFFVFIFWASSHPSLLFLPPAVCLIDL